MRKIVVGVMIAVAAGLIVQGINFGKKQFDRKSQIRYLRNLMVEAREAIYNAPSIPLPVGEDLYISDGEIRWKRFREYRSDVFSALNERSTDMSYDEVDAVRKTFRVVDDYIEVAENLGGGKLLIILK